MLKAIIFDVDNTLIDFYRMKNLSVLEAIDAMIDAGLDIKKDKALRLLHKTFNEVGLEAHHIYQNFTKRVAGKTDYKAVAAAIVAHKRVWNGLIHTYPGVIRTLIALKELRLRLAVVSDANKVHVFERLYGMRVVDFFDVIVSHDDTHKYKPAKKPFLFALNKLNLKAEECMMVGDWLRGDIGGAKKLGMYTCLADYGAPSKEARKILNPAYLKKIVLKPDFKANQFSDILPFVKKLLQK